MTPRPSSERIEEIRDNLKILLKAEAKSTLHEHMDACLRSDAAQELFAWIDAITSERDEALRKVEALTKEKLERNKWIEGQAELLNAATNDRDLWRARAEKYREAAMRAIDAMKMSDNSHLEYLAGALESALAEGKE